MTRAARPFVTGCVAAALLVVAAALGPDAVALLVVAAGTWHLARRGTAAHWVAALLVTAVLARGITRPLGLSGALNFLHFPLAGGFLFVALARGGIGAARKHGATLWICALFAVVAASSVASPVQPVRAALFTAIFVEPLVVVLALRLTDPTGEERRAIGMVAAAIFAIQLPVVVGQSISFGIVDRVQGTLVGQGSGAHVIAGVVMLYALCVLSFFLARRTRARVVLAVGVAVLYVGIAAGALQVLIAGGIALVAASTIAALRARSDVRTRAVVVTVAVAGGCVVVATVAFVLPGRLRRIERLADPRNHPVAQLVRERARGDPIAFLFGSGPGAGASKASLILTPRLRKEDSPVRWLRLPPTRTALDMVGRSIDPQYGGSAERFVSSAISLLVDVGLVGLVAWVALMAVVVWRLDGSDLVFGARAALIMTFVLAFIDLWLETPEFTVPLAVVVGLATAPRDTVATEAT